MTEAAFMFNQEVSERANVKRSASHKANGASVTKLGNKKLTDKEIAERHGPCESYGLGNFMTFSKFEKCAPDLKVEYVNKLMDKYDIELQHISLYLFHKGTDGLKSHLRNVKMEGDRALKFCDYQKPRAKTGLLKFQADIEEWKRREATAKEIDEMEAQRRREIIWNAEFVTFEEFMAFPIDGKIKYCNNLITKYQVSLATISTVLFEKNTNYLRDHFQKKEVYGQIQKAPKRASSASPFNKAFDMEVKKWKGIEVVEEAVVKKTPVPMPEFETMDEAEIAEVAEETQFEPVDVSAEESVEEPVQLEVEPELESVSHQVTIANPQDSMAFTSTYVSENGLDEHQLYALISLFQNKKVRVVIDIQTL